MTAIGLVLVALLAEPGPAIDVYTMGPGDALFSRWGHSAVCVTDERSPQGRCYNYGTTDFSTPIPLTWDFIRGRAQFWVSVIDARRMVGFYEQDDRSVWRQRLALTSSQAKDLAERLEASTAEDVKYYRYHHFYDNCTTRIRDLIGQATKGALQKSAQEMELIPFTFRDYARLGFGDAVPFQMLVDLVLGRGGDHRTKSWDAMFIPIVLMTGIQRHFGVEPEVLYERRGPSASLEIGVHEDFPSPSPRLVSMLGFAALGLLLALLRGLAGTGRAQIFARLFIGGVLGGLGLLLWTLAAVSAVPELRFNELLIVFVPFDLGLVALGARRDRYVRLRLAAVLLAVLGALLGLLGQPVWGPAALVALPLWAELRLGRSEVKPD